MQSIKIVTISNLKTLILLGTGYISVGLLMLSFNEILPLTICLIIAGLIVLGSIYFSDKEWKESIANVNTLSSSNHFGFRFSRHFLFWFTYLMVFTILNKINIPEESFGSLVSKTLIFFLPVDLIATYINLYALMPRYLYRGHFIRYILSVTFLAFSFSILARIVFLYAFVPIYFQEMVGKIGFWGFGYFDYLISTNSIVVLAAAIKLILRWFEIKNRQQDLERQSIKSELDMLKMQVNPHFLFNTLNNIDSLIYSNPEKASESIIKLSDLMRYMIYEAQSGIVLLSREVEYLNNLIDLQALRFTQKDFIKFNQMGNIENQQIGALLFVPFVENAIKHGDRSVHTPGIDIELKIDQNIITFQCSNYINKEQQSTFEVGGIGLQNVKRRLEILYPLKHQLSLEEVDNKFLVELTIELPTK